MKRSILVSFVFLLLSLPISASDKLVAATQEAKATERVQNQQREALFLTKEQELKALKDKLTAQKAALQSDIDRMSEQFSANEAHLAEKEQELHLESGSLGELFGVVRQVAKEIQIQLNHSILSIGQQAYLDNIDAIVDAQKLPSKKQLYTLWYTLSEPLSAASQMSYVNVPYIQNDGVIGSKEVLRLGAFGLLDENGYLEWHGSERGAYPYSVQPEQPPSAALSDQLVALDPTQGKLLEQLALKPTIRQRLEHGGVIGKVIVGLLGIGLVIGTIQGCSLFVSRSKIYAQLKNPQMIGNNALGRVLSVYKYAPTLNVEALELRLYEAVLDEQRKLERGLPMLKLLAALSPMLGLLGTVTGMIETFQVITQYGNADPKIMAGGISTALITTVLGLVAAMPLLFIHNVLSTLAENIRTLLEKQGIGLVAQRAECEMGG